MEVELNRIYPTIDELSQTYRSLQCKICNSVFRTEPNLKLHLIKIHKHENSIWETAKNRAYHCPINTCNYNRATFFKSFKLLKQHYIKVHKEKIHKCFSCNDIFPSEVLRDKHYEYCNIQFKCCDCEAYYYRYETLKTHSRRKKHKILEKSEYKMRTDQGSQTELKSVKETQTISKIKPKSNQTIHTQTDNKNKKNKIVKRNYKISVDTQTNEIDSKSASCNTSFEINEFDFIIKAERYSSGTQTIYSDPIVSCDSTHTDTSDLIEHFNTNVFNCMETQTDLMFNEDSDDLFNYDYSNMYTQTCENLLLTMYGLNDTQTQTAFDDYLKSVESQTVMTNAALKDGCSREISHMETQTDIEFKQMLEEINA